MNAVTYPISAQQFEVADASDVVFGIKIKNLVERLKELEPTGDINKIIKTMMEIKSEIEFYSGTSISIDKLLPEVRKELKCKGYNIPEQHLSAYKKIIKRRNTNHFVKLNT